MQPKDRTTNLELARHLVRASRASREQIDQIVEADDLFESIRVRINAEQMSSAQFSPSYKRSAWSIYSPKLLSACIALSAIALIMAVSIANRWLHETYPFEISNNSRISSETFELGGTPNNIQKLPKTRVNVRKARTATKWPLPHRQDRERVPSQSGKKPEPEVFYSLSSGGTIEADGDLRRVRTQLSRSDLFALGVTAPMEDDIATIKADLLIALDGKPRAIRFVVSH